MLKTNSSRSFFKVLVCCFSFTSAEVIWEENFDGVDPAVFPTTNTTIGNIQVSNSLTGEVTSTIPAGFTSASGNVILLSAGTSKFSAIRPALNPIILPAIANGGTWTLSFDMFIPAELIDPVGGMANYRWKDGGANNSNGPSDYEYETQSAGEHNITYSGTFPIDNGNGPFLPLNVRPFINLDQQSVGEAVANYVYIDNISFEVDLSNDDPNLISAPVNFGTLVQSEGSYSRPVFLRNEGVNNILEITGATVAGENADLFGVANATFPISINPGESATIDVTFDPADGLGVFSAQLEIASNDQSEPSQSYLLSGTTELAFEGRELIMNGDFEAGDISNWLDNGTFVFTSETVHNGVGAGVYSTNEANEWGNARLATTPPLGAVDLPDHLAVTPEMHGFTLFYSGWYFRPSESGMADDDTVGLSVRWNGIQAGAANLATVLCNEMPYDTWVRISGSTTIPATDAEGNPVVSLRPAWSFRDVGSNNPGGLMMVIDDISLKTDASLPVIEVEAVITDFIVDFSQELLEITWTSNIGATYSVERSTDLVNWLELDDSIVPAEATHTYSDPEVATLEGVKYFYRVTQLESAP